MDGSFIGARGRRMKRRDFLKAVTALPLIEMLPAPAESTAVIIGGVRATTVELFGCHECWHEKMEWHRTLSLAEFEQVADYLQHKWGCGAGVIACDQDNRVLFWRPADPIAAISGMLYNNKGSGPVYKRVPS